VEERSGDLQEVVVSTFVRRAALAGVLALFMACGDGDQFTAPTLPRPVAAPVPSPLPSDPPLSGATTTYQFSAPLSYHVSPWTERSSFVLYESGAFSLQYEAFEPYLGAYQREGNRITFAFSGHASSTGTAIGTLTDGGDLLEIRFSRGMQLSDFEDAIYRWAR
jgi:hypothetical protein